jgi:PKHD-type hydroxylase
MEFRASFPLNNTIDQTNYYCINNSFNEEELGWINNLEKLYPFIDASVVGIESTDNHIRKSKIKWIHHDDKSWWVYDKLSAFAIEANKNYWGFNLHTIVDSIQYTEYYEGGGHYDWHVDIGPGSINHRKVSITIQLSDPEDYDGGDLEIWAGGDFKKIEKQKGTAILFPSFLMHRITPITRGIRKSLVLWVGGDSYK